MYKLRNCTLNTIRSTLPKGFTLIEILVVISILAVLAAIGAIVYQSVLKNSRDQQRLRDLTTIKQALELYRSDNKNYPTSVADLTPGNNTDKRYLESWPTDPASVKSYQYLVSPSQCDNNTTSCTSFILCAKSDGNWTGTVPAGCNTLNCSTGDKCDMGLSSD